MSSAKTVVVGGAGFLGSHLIDVLLRETPDQIICVDNLSKGNLGNLAHLKGQSRFEFHQIDAMDLDALKKVCKGAVRIANMAAGKIPRYGGRLDTLRTNSVTMMNILDVARENQARVLLASTSDVYGKNPSLPFSETHDSLIGPSSGARWAYAVSKLFDEHLAYAYQEEHALKVSLVRIFGSFGPRHHLSWWGGPQSVFINAVLRSEPIEIHGDGRQTRSFCFATDTAEGIFRALTFDAAVGEMFNIGNTHEISILDLAKTIWRLMENKGEVPLKFVGLETFSRNYEDVRARVPDISKAKKLLDWSPKVALEDGLRQTIAWQRQADQRS